MPAGPVILFSAHKADLNLNDLLGVTLKMALLTAAYTPNTATDGDAVWADISTHEITAGNGYTAGGQALAGVAKTAIAGGFKLASNSPVWTASGGPIPAWRHGVLYVAGSLWGVTNPLIGYFVGDATPADIPATASGNLLTVVCPADGWFDVT
jgi:hypothetical protein